MWNQNGLTVAMPPGHYGVMAQTFDAGQEAPFEVILSSTADIKVTSTVGVKL